MANTLSHDSDNSVNSEAPLCGCGCGQKTTRIDRTTNKRGRTKGKYNRFLPQHHLQIANRNRPIAQPEDLFWRHVQKGLINECWEWHASRTAQGYGRFNYKGSVQMASHVAYVLTYGAVPKGLVVRHKCDNPPCCNPAHLELGTYTDNILDRISRIGGGKHHKARLMPNQVNQVRRRLATGEQQIEIARSLGVSRSVIYGIASNKRYQHVIQDQLNTSTPSSSHPETELEACASSKTCAGKIQSALPNEVGDTR